MTWCAQGGCDERVLWLQEKRCDKRKVNTEFVGCDKSAYCAQRPHG